MREKNESISTNLTFQFEGVTVYANFLTHLQKSETQKSAKTFRVSYIQQYVFIINHVI